MRPLFLLLLALLPVVGAQPTARLKDLVVPEGGAPTQLTGYGLLVGLDRTGDRARGQRGTPYTVQSVANMLQRFGIVVDPSLLASRNVAAVMVTAQIDAFSGPGSTLDVTVSSLGDARSLSGGVLLQTPLLDPLTQQVFAMAQGPISTGGVSAEARGASVQINNTNTGRVPNGALVMQTPPRALGTDRVGLVLKRPDFTNAVRMAEVINQTFPGSAQVEHAGLVRVTVPGEVGGSAGLMARLETLSMAVDVPARVVVNERTGTVVAGGEVRISQVLVTYGGLVVSTQETPVVSQPAPFTDGTTQTATVGSARADEQPARSVVLPPNTDVNQLAAALNDLGIATRDVIAILQAIDRAGALQGELVIL